MPATTRLPLYATVIELGHRRRLIETSDLGTVVFNRVSFGRIELALTKELVPLD
jgi:hypothetical protein